MQTGAVVLFSMNCDACPAAGSARRSVRASFLSNKPAWSKAWRRRSSRVPCNGSGPGSAPSPDGTEECRRPYRASVTLGMFLGELRKRSKKMRKRWPPHSTLPQPPETTKPAKRRALRCSNMAEAMGFELMDLLQSTVFKTFMYAYTAYGLQGVLGANTLRVAIGCRPCPARGDFLVLEPKNIGYQK